MTRLVSAAVLGSIISFVWIFIAGLLLGPWAMLFSFPVGLCWIAAGCTVAFIGMSAHSRSPFTTAIVAVTIGTTVIAGWYGLQYVLDEGEAYAWGAVWSDVPNGSVTIRSRYDCARSGMRDPDFSWVESEVRAIFDHGELVVEAGCLDADSPGSPDGAARALVIMTQPLMNWFDLPFPRKGTNLVYVQDGDGWKRYPQNASLSRSELSIGPSSRWIESFPDGGWRMEVHFADTEVCSRNGPGESCGSLFSWSSAPPPQRFVTYKYPARFRRSEARLEE